MGAATVSKAFLLGSPASPSIHFSIPNELNLSKANRGETSAHFESVESHSKAMMKSFRQNLMAEDGGHFRLDGFSFFSMVTLWPTEAKGINMSVTVEKQHRLKQANEYGSIDVTVALPKSLVHVRGQRLQPLCRKLGIKYAQAHTGWRFGGSIRYPANPTYDGVVISTRAKLKLLALIKEREQKAKAKAEKQAAKEAKEKAKLLAEKMARLKSEYPDLAEQHLAKLVDVRVVGQDDLGYQHGLGTADYWSQLGFSIKHGNVNCRAVIDGHVVNVFQGWQVKERQATLPTDELAQEWLAKYGSATIALIHALRFANRLQKIKRLDGFYDLKDMWIRMNQSSLTDGRVSREETKWCYCIDNGYTDTCWRCDGSGIYSKSTLYEHHFEVEGHTFVFHSYVKPSKLSKIPGADLKKYGRPFDDADLPLPPQSQLVELVKLWMAT